MAMFSYYTLFLVLIQIAIAGKNPGWPKGYKIRNYTPKQPKGLCNQCTIDLNNVSPSSGDFFNTKRLYKINTDPKRGCLKEVANYVQMNPRDKVTRNAFNKFVKSKNYNSNDYYKVERLVYTNCELCCDCIDFKAGRTSGQLDVTRPNCALHFYWDNANKGLFPDWEYTDAAGRPNGKKMKNDVNTQFKCYYKKNNLVQVRKTGLRRLLQDRTLSASCGDVNGAVKRVEGELKKLVRNFGCSGRQGFAACWDMEFRQGRICGGDKKCRV